MDEQLELEKQAKTYFVAKQVRSKKDDILAIVFGIVAFVFFVLSSEIPFMIALSLLCTILCVICILSKKEVRISGKEYDSIVSQMIKKSTINPIQYLGIDKSEIEEIKPLSFSGYKYIGADNVRMDFKDNIWRSNLYEVVMVFFTKNEIYLYKILLNTLTGKKTYTSEVIFYEDVVSVSTRNEVEKVKNDRIEYVSFNLITKGGNNFSISLFQNSNSQRSINAMRAMIKEKKINHN